MSSNSARITPTSALAAQSQNSRSEFWIGDRGASCYIRNDASKMYCVSPPPSNRREVITGDGTRLRVECVGNIDGGFHGRSEEHITLCDVSYVPDLKFNISSFHKTQQTHVIILDAQLEPAPWGKVLPSLARRADRTCERAGLRPVL